MLAEQALDSLTMSYGDSLAIIAYNHTYSSHDADSMRREFYNHSQANDPTVIIDGTDELFIADPAVYYSTYDQHIQVAKNYATYFNLYLTASASTATGNMQLKVVSTDTLPTDSIVAFVAVCEDSMQGILKSFNYVCQYLYYIPVNLSYPDSLDTTIVFANTIQPSKMRAVAFVQNIDTKKIMQAITKKFVEE